MKQQPLTDLERRDWELALSEYMQMICERLWGMSWKTGLTEILIAACQEVRRTGRPTTLDGCYLSPAEGEVLQFMVDRLGYWMALDGPYQPPAGREVCRRLQIGQDQLA